VNVLDDGRGSLLESIPLGPRWATGDSTTGAIVLDPATGHVLASSSEGTAVWMVDARRATPTR
jgi:hypothetical protein